MSDDRPPRRPRHPRDLNDDEVVEVPETERSFPRLPPRPREPFTKLAPTQSETIAEILSVQRKMALQMDGFGGMMNRRFDLFHEELALQRSSIDNIEKIVKESHAPRLDKVEATLGQKVVKGGGIVGLVVVALPLLSEVLPKWAGVFERIGALLQ
jgi:hypothetical protein